MLGTRMRMALLQQSVIVSGPLLPFNYASNGLGTTWNNILDEEFSGSVLSPTWAPYWFANGAVQNSIPMNAANVTVGGGFLTETLVSGGTSGGLISSNPSGGGSFAFTYGYVEALINLPSDGAGGISQWPAFWLTGQNWPTTGEWDIIEGLSGVPTFHYHYLNPTTGLAASVDRTLSVTSGWHTFGLNWQPGRGDLYIDGTLVQTIQNSDLAGGAVITSSPLYVVAELAKGTTGPTPEVLSLDYCRVWQTTLTAPANTSPPTIS